MKRRGRIEKESSECQRTTDDFFTFTSSSVRETLARHGVMILFWRGDRYVVKPNEVYHSELCFFK